MEGSNKAAPLNNVAKGVPERRYNIRRENERKSNPNRAPPKGGAAYDGEKEEGKKKKKRGRRRLSNLPLVDILRKTLNC